MHHFVYRTPSLGYEIHTADGYKTRWLFPRGQYEQAEEAARRLSENVRAQVKPMTRLAKRIRRRLVKECGLDWLPEEVFIERTYAGYWQRAMGALSWTLVDRDGVWLDVGSHSPASEIAAAPRLSTDRGHDSIIVVYSGRGRT